MRTKAAILAFLCAGILGCKQDKPVKCPDAIVVTIQQPENPDPPAVELMIGCHMEGDKFVFDNEHWAGSCDIAKSSVSCANAKSNWFRMDRHSECIWGMTGKPDPKTGLLR